jgi:phosphatidylinositol glycan class W
MDIGVGAFIFANGLVSPEARGKRAQLQRVGARSCAVEWARRVSATARGVAPCLALGLGRLLTVKAADYQEHVTEYGVHWNFFLTLGAVAMLTAIVRPPPAWSGVLGLLLLGMHHWALTVNLHSPRADPSQSKAVVL